MARLIPACFAAVSLASLLLGTTAAASALAQADAGLPDVLAKSIKYYSTLTSYADTGTVRRETAGIVDDARFTTYFRRTTRDLFFDFQSLTSLTRSTRFSIDMTSARTVIWMSKGEMQTYDGRTQAHEAINPEAGGQVRALQNGNYASQGVSILIPSLLYAHSRLPSTILQIGEAAPAGVEEIDGRRCHKITGVAAQFYPSGQRTNVRAVTVWIDSETQLIRRVFEDTPKNYPAGGVSRLTITLQPQANPTIPDAKFQFTIPAR
jgi:outer membrane lipoprotein-sorting protein